MNETTINTPGGKLFCREWTSPAGATEAVLLLHGVESHSGWFTEIGRELSGLGYAVFAYDRPGWGQSAGIKGHLNSYNDEILRIESLVNALRVRHNKVHLAGLSWGGMLALYTVLRRRVLFDSLTMIAPGIFAKADLPITDKLLTAGGIILGKNELPVDIPINVEHFTKKAEFTDFIKNDPHRTKQVTASFCFETLKMRAFCREEAPRRTLPPTTLLLAGDDKIIDNTATTALLERKAEVEIRKLDAMEHSLVFECPQKTAQAIADTAKRTPKPGRSVLVFGAGAVGSMVGGLLALGGCKTTLIARQKHADIINEKGLTLQIGSGQRIIKDNLTAVTSIDEVTEVPDIVIIAVKSFDTEIIKNELLKLINDYSVIVSLQNGVNNERKLAETFSNNTILGGAICAYLNFAEPGKIVWSNDRGGLAIGLYKGDDYTGLNTAETLRRSGLEVTYCNDAMRVKWSKLMLNTAFNAINAATGLSTAEILSHKSYSNLAINALREGFAVMKAQGTDPVNLPGYDVTKLATLCKAPLFAAKRILARVTAKDTNTVSSMQQDIKRGRGRTEIDEINGAIVEAGKKAGIATPANNKLCQMVSKISENEAEN